MLVPVVIDPLPASEAWFQRGCAFSKDGPLSSPWCLYFLLSPGAKQCAFPAALLKSCLVIICRPEAEPLLFGRQPKSSFFSFFFSSLVNDTVSVCLCTAGVFAQ